MGTLRRTLTGLVALGLIGTGLVVVAGAAQADDFAYWSLAQDATAAPADNPVADQYGNAGVWSYLAGSGTDPSTFALMDHGTPDACGPGVDLHDAGNSVPLVLVNPTDSDTPCRGDIENQAHGVSVHPSPTADAIIAWTSPISSNISFSAMINDGDPHGGNGFAYTVLVNNVVLQTGTVPNGAGTYTGNLTLHVTSGDRIYVLIDANGDYSYDTTEVDETITSQPAATITSSSPSSAPQGSTRSVTVTGSNLTSSSAVSLDDATGVTVGAPTAQTSTTITVPVTVASDAPTNVRHWVLSDPSLSGPVTCDACVLRIPATPTLTSIVPSQIRRGSTVRVHLNGTQFKPGVTVKVTGDGVTIDTVIRVSSTILYVDITVDANATRGKRTVTVINPGGGRAALVRGLMLS